MMIKHHKSKSKTTVHNMKYKTVADLEIFRGGFSFTKIPAKLKVKTKKKGYHQLFQSFFTSSSKLPFSTAPKPTH